MWVLSIQDNYLRYTGEEITWKWDWMVWVQRGHDFINDVYVLIDAPLRMSLDVHLFVRL